MSRSAGGMTYLTYTALSAAMGLADSASCVPCSLAGGGVDHLGETVDGFN
jgi:hypothetical protein